MSPFRLVFGLLLCGLFALAAPVRAGGPIASGVTTSGSLAGPTFTESWTFSGVMGERIVVAAVTTSVLNTVTSLRAPGGTVVYTSAADRLDYQLLSTGTYTIEISDQGLNDPGTYAITYLNLTSGPLTHAGDLDGGACASGDVKAGTLGVVADLDAFTFAGTAGQRVVFGVHEGTVTPFNVNLTLYPPGGGPQEANTSNNRIDQQLAATGTYTVVVEDIGDDHTGSYTVSHLNVTGGPHSTLADPDGGAIPSATSATGTMTGVIDFDAFTVTGTVGDRIAVVALTTSGTLNTQTYLYPPNGGASQISSAGDRWDFQLTQTGTHTIVIEDQSFGESGGYTISFLNLTSGPLTHAGDLDGGPIASGEVRTGALSVADLDAFTFSGTAGQRVLFGTLEGTITPFNVNLTLYPPGGGPQEANTSNNRIDQQLAATGTYTVVVEDIGNDHAGNYTVSHLNVSAGPHSTLADPDGAAIPSATSATGTITGVLDFDAFTVTGTAGDRIAVVALTTSGTLNTQTYLYPPNGGASQISGGADRWDFQLTQTGTHTIVIEDQSFGESGGYTISFLNLTSGPLTQAGDLDGGPIASGEVRTGALAVADLDAFTFSGTAGQRVLFGTLEGTVTPFNVNLILYPPGGGPQETNTSNNRIDWQLAASGTYVVVVEDIGDDHAGSYTVSHLNVSAGPHSTLADPDGGAVASGTSASGTMNGVVDFDAFTISGTTGERVIGVAIATTGSLNTMAYLYPPSGGAPQVSTAGDRWEFQLTQTGTHTVVIEDQNFGDTGTYAFTWLDVTSGPYTHAGDSDGGPIASSEMRQGTVGPAPDLDGYTFSGTAGDRVVIAGVATAAAPFNTVVTLYPPGGGAAVSGGTGNDRLDLMLTSTGTYTVVVDDVGNDHTGTYALSFVNVFAGPVITGTDPDGGGISAGQVRVGNITPVPDLDVFWFNTVPGDVADVSCITTSGALNTQSYLYPPSGGDPVIVTSADVWSYVIPAGAGGRYGLLIQHSDLTQTGGYQLGLSGTLTTVDVPGVTTGPLALSPAHPNPARSQAAFTLDLPRPGEVVMRVYDLRGALVRTIADRSFDPGTHRLVWDGRDDRGQRLGSGIYLVRAEAGGERFTRRVAWMP